MRGISAEKAFLRVQLYSAKLSAARLKREEAKTIAKNVHELGERSIDAAQARATVATRATKQLWRDQKQHALIKAGLTLIALPEPTVSTVLGSALTATGTVKEAIRNHAFYIDDLYKTFHQTPKEPRNIEKIDSGS